jgi:hypothetical protein
MDLLKAARHAKVDSKKVVVLNKGSVIEIIFGMPEVVRQRVCRDV